VLDEPTNDLDADTLDLLEEQLMQYQGTLLLVSHDREFVDNVVTSTLVFEHGNVNEYVGGYQDWLRQRAQPASKQSEKKTAAKLAPASPASTPAKKKLSYKEQQELKELPAHIEALERDIATLQQTLSDPGFFKQDSASVTATTSALAEKEQALEQAFQRWSELEP
jgi:ABC transport system ATP-binding/permease protein